jgi:hypothetical protein
MFHLYQFDDISMNSPLFFAKVKLYADDIYPVIGSDLWKVVLTTSNSSPTDRRNYHWKTCAEYFSVQALSSTKIKFIWIYLRVS